MASAPGIARRAAVLAVLALAAGGARATPATFAEASAEDVAAAVAARGRALIMMYSPWCGHSRKLLASFELASARLAAEVPLLLVDATHEQALASALNVTRYPMLIWVERRLSSEDSLSGSEAERVPGDLHAAGFGTRLVTVLIQQWVERRLYGVLRELGSERETEALLTAAALEAGDPLTSGHISLALVARLQPGLRGSVVHRGLLRLAEKFARTHRGIPARFGLSFDESLTAASGTLAGQAEACSLAGEEGACTAAPLALPAWATAGGWELRLHVFQPDGASAQHSAQSWLRSGPPRLPQVIGAVRSAREWRGTTVWTREAARAAAREHLGESPIAPAEEAGAGGRDTGRGGRGADDEAEDVDEAEEVEAVLGAFTRHRSRPLVTQYSDLSARTLFEDPLSRFHLVALLPGAWAELGGRASPFAEADAQRAEREAALSAALRPPPSGPPPPRLPVHSDSERAGLQARAVAVLADSAAALDGEAVGVEVDASQHPTVLTYLGVKRASLPAFVLLDTNRSKAVHVLPAADGGGLPSVHVVVSALRRFVSGEIRAAFASEPEPEVAEQARSAMRVLVGSTYHTAAHEAAVDVLVLFHAPWCAHCTAMLSTLHQLAADHQGDEGLRVCSMKMPGNEADGLAVHIFPSLFLFPAVDVKLGRGTPGEPAPAARPGYPASAAMGKEPVLFTGVDRALPALERFLAQHRRTVHAPLMIHS
ncbi:hypothetical protein T492DRAFT_1100560 [Pavlovales sp. CCMP2436]|nr:hypothetical protein T492DRAFT_1100560 [Pavlovales sp. CCMP2436]